METPKTINGAARRRRVYSSFRPEPFTILEELLRVARVAIMRAAAAGCKLM
jgi:hypothetical protein